MIKRLAFFLGVVLLVLAALFFWWKISLSPVNTKDTTPRTFIIAKGDGVRDVARKLKSSGLVRDQIAFFILVRFRLGIDKSIQAGSYHLSPALSAYQLANKLTLGTEDTWVTIPEGWRSEEILEYLQTQGFNTTGENWKADEGKLFPDTYLLPKLATPSAIRNLLRQTFDTKTAGLRLDDQTLIVASLVEREAKKAEDRPLIASVLKNRLNAGMALDVDATIQYALGKPGNWWPKDLTQDDLKVKSPYNTYQNPGFPPAPICNPGLSSIKAAQNPAQTDYLYYLSDKQGNIHYARTLQEHNANVAKYL